LEKISFLQLQIERKTAMKTTFNSLVFSLTTVNRQHIQLAFIILSLTMLVLGLGAPEDGGGNTLRK
jgi:hypothetical protein